MSEFFFTESTVSLGGIFDLSVKVSKIVLQSNMKHYVENVTVILRG